MRPSVCTAGRAIHVLLIYILVAIDVVSLFENVKLVELEPQIITSKLGSIIYFTIFVPEKHNIFNISLVNPSGRTVNFVEYVHKRQNYVEGTIFDNIREHEHNTLKKENFINDNLGRENWNFNTIDIADKVNCYHGDISYNKCIRSLGKIRIGPLQEEDHGNWVISVYFYDSTDGNIVEAFRVISVEIVESVSTIPKNSLLTIGETYKLSLKLDIPDLESCELIVPKTTADRYYERDLNNWNKCGYIVRNVTAEDQGVWKIVAVGKIVYEGTAYLYITKQISTYIQSVIITDRISEKNLGS